MRDTYITPNETLNGNIELQTVTMNYIADITTCAKPRKYIFHFKVEKSSENIPHFSLASQSELCVCVCVC